MAKPDTKIEPTTCRTCGAPYDEAGDGWDGECPTCADRRFEKEDEH